MFIVWTVERETGTRTATLKATRTAAVRQYNKDSREHTYSENGWARAADAEPWQRSMVGLKPFVPSHPIHRMTATDHCVDCQMSAAELHEWGYSISGYDAEYEPVPA